LSSNVYLISSIINQCLFNILYYQPILSSNVYLISSIINQCLFNILYYLPMSI
ncbi:uncharacterized protein LOC131927777, partial [Physella acuta]|uniref:uncharacterized protein LOC131927777 n=1 Tax=Physella acuta TaxID=109671 RepID=UPI0027DACC55